MSAQVAPGLPTIAFEKYTLPNGLDVILSEDHRLPLVAVDVWYHAGPANEAAGRTGFAHLFEHMMFQGSKHVPGDSHFRTIESVGGTGINGSTNFDRTNYFETLPANQLELGLWLESDRMGYLLDTVDEKKFANQQDVVRNERRQSRENQPYAMGGEAVYQTIFPKGHPYYGSIMGSHADIQAATLDNVKAFFKQYYAPNNASLAIVGDFDKTAAKALVAKYFGTFKRGPAVPKPNVTTRPITSVRRVVVQSRVQLPQVTMAWLSPAFFKPGDADADAAANVLGGDASSRLYKSLVYDKQIAQSVSASQQSLELGSIFSISAIVRPSKTIEEVEAAILAEVERLAKDGPDAREVERARNTFETGELQRLDLLGGFGGVADTLSMFNHYVGDPGYLPKYIDEHRKITPERVKAFAQQYLKPDARVVVQVVSGTPDFGPVVPTPPAPQSADGTGSESVNADEPWRAKPPVAGPDRAMSIVPARSFTLANGLTVLYQVRAGMPVATASLVFKNGGDANPANLPGLANFVVAMLDQGTATRDATRIADDAAQLGASLTTASTKDQMTVTVGALTRNFSAALGIAADVALRPSFPQVEVDRQKTSRLASLTGARQNPGTVAQFEANLALYGAAHPYAYLELGTPEAVAATTRDDLVSFWKKTFVPGNAALVVAGPMDEAALRPVVEKAFGAWPAGTFALPALPAPQSSTARVVVVDTPGAPQTQLVVATIGAERSAPMYPSLTVMNTALGGLFSSRINLNLREEHGYTYGARSQFVFRKSAGPFLVLSGVRTDVTAPAVGEVMNELRRITEGRLTPAELTLAKDSIVRSMPSDFQTGASTVGSLSNLFVYGLGLDYYAKLPQQIAAVTIESAQAAARQYLDPKNMVVVAVGDRAKIETGLRDLNIGPVEPGVTK